MKVKTPQFKFGGKQFLLASFATVLLALTIFFVVYQITKPGSAGGSSYVSKACGPYPYCRASNQDDSAESGNFLNIARLTRFQIIGLKEWLKATDRTFGVYNDPQEGNPFQIFSSETTDDTNRPFTDGEMRSLLEIIDKTESRGKLWITVVPDFINGIQKLEVRKNDKVLDYSGQTLKLAGEEDWKFVVLETNFKNGCPVDPCENALEVS